MRYAGKTFYQSGFEHLPNGEVTTLQVVDNVGWMTPYVSCMMVVVAMVFHFGQTLLKYLHRRRRDTQSMNSVPDDDAAYATLASDRRRWNAVSWLVTAGLAATVLATLGIAATPKNEKVNQFHLKEFGELPMWYRGRLMPIDSFARNALMQLSDYQTFKDAGGKSQPAVRWLLT